MRNGYQVVDAHIHIYNSICNKRVHMNPPIFGIETAMQLLDSAGVYRAVLMQNPAIGIINDELVKAIKKYPGRLIGAIQVDPLDVNALNSFQHFAQHPEMRLLKLDMSWDWGWTGIYPKLQMDSDEIVVLLNAAPAGFAVVIDTGAIGSTGYQLDAIDRLSSRFPMLSFIVEHLGYLISADLENAEKLNKWRSLITLGKKPNVYFGISAVNLLIDDEYPCYRSLEFIRTVKDTIGAEKLLWGSDIPGTLFNCKYWQMLDSVLVYADFLNNEEKTLVMGGNALRILWNEMEVTQK